MSKAAGNRIVAKLLTKDIQKTTRLLEIRLAFDLLIKQDSPMGIFKGDRWKRK